MGRFKIYRGLVQLIDSQGTGGSSPTNTTFTAGTLLYNRKEEEVGTYPIGAGAYKVTIRNTGLEPITVDGETIKPNGLKVLQSEFNKTKNVQDFVPAISIVVPANGKVWYETVFPS